MWLRMFISVYLGSTATSEAVMEIVLPGTEALQRTFKLKTGYLEPASGQFLHFWFVESERNPSKDPLIFWFNGGPMCSSLAGFIRGMGPVNLKDDGSWRLNPYSWTKIASVVWIETPPGAGFSYAVNDTAKRFTNNTKAAALNYNAIKKFFDMFQEYRMHEVFLMGESYAAIYITTIIDKYLDDKSRSRFNLQGIAIGNGILSFSLMTIAKARFVEGFGLSGENSHQVFQRCCPNCLEKCPIHQKMWEDDACMTAVEDDGTDLDNTVNVYDVFRDCFVPEENDVESHENPQKEDYVEDEVSYSEKSYEDFKIQRKPGNNKYEYDVDILYDTAPSIKRMLQTKKIRVLLFHGDTDMKCGALLGELFAKNLNIPLKTKKRPWYSGKQVAGFRTEYEGLTLLTFRSTGHMVIERRPPQIQYAIQQFMKNGYLSLSFFSQINYF